LSVPTLLSRPQLPLQSPLLSPRWSPVKSAPAVPVAVVSDVPRFLSRDACLAIVSQVRSFGVTEDTKILLTSGWRGNVRWARNRISVASDWRDTRLTLGWYVSLNQVDATSIRTAVDQYRQGLLFGLAVGPSGYGVSSSSPMASYPKTHIWSDATYAQSPLERSVLAGQLVASAEQAGMLSAGYLSVEANGYGIASGAGFLYAPQTLAQCSITVRDPQGTGSGWAGVSSYDWGRIDAPKLAAIALDKCLKSRNPQKIEPGRYTTILEPQATFEFISKVINLDYLEFEKNAGNDNVARPFNKSGRYEYKVGNYGPSYAFRKTRLGEPVFDSRLRIWSDPLDPELGTLPFDITNGDPYVPVTWVDHGVLTTLPYNSAYANDQLRLPSGKPWSGAFRIESSDPPVSVEEMIATTKRGLLVTRLVDVEIFDPESVLCTGLTRDGVWLIENGKISRPVQNFRFTESPMFAFNNVDQIGIPVPVFSPGSPAVVPAIKVRDFSFTSIVDAV